MRSVSVRRPQLFFEDLAEAEQPAQPQPQRVVLPRTLRTAHTAPITAHTPTTIHTIVSWVISLFYYLIDFLYSVFGYRRVLFFFTSLRSFSSSPLDTLQTAFALRSKAASVVYKKNQKNFRAHPCGMLWPCLTDWLGCGFSAGALIMGKNPTRAAHENLSPTNKAERRRGRPGGTTSAKVFWVPFLQNRVAYRGQRPLAGFAEVVRGRRSQKIRFYPAQRTACEKSMN